ncbi:MAG TPA: hemolysin family protein [Acidobacteriota bacterium]
MDVDPDASLLLVLKLTAVLGLVLLNAFFVAAEFALVKVRTTQLEARVLQGSRRAALARTLTRHLDAYLSATQLGITIASLGLGWIGEPAVASLLRGPLVGLGVESEALIHSISLALGFSIITFLHIVLGELAPKSLAIMRPEGTTLVIAAPLRWFYRITFPAIWLLNGVSNLLLRGIGITPASEHELAHSEEELRLLLASQAPGPGMTATARELMLAALDLRNRTARQVLVPRSEVVYLDVQLPLAENLERARKGRHTRFPLCDGNLDQAFGMVHLKDLMWLIDREGGEADLSKVRRKIAFVPESARLEALLRTFRRERSHLAMVVDEYGGALGIVTLENVIEELVGEIQDEFDEEAPAVVELAPGDYQVDGALPLFELKERCDIQVEDPGVATVGGLILRHFNRLPEQGEKVPLKGYEAEVLKMEGRRIALVRLRRV